MAFVILFLNHIKKALNYPDLRGVCVGGTNDSKIQIIHHFCLWNCQWKKVKILVIAYCWREKYILNEGHWNTIKLLTKSLTLFGNGEKKLVCIFLSFTASSQCSQHFYQTFIESISSLKLKIRIYPGKKRSKSPNYWNFSDHSKKYRMNKYGKLTAASILISQNTSAK